MTDTIPNSELPLSGVKVVELADGLGELCGKMLTDFGAEVIKVEPHNGSGSRKMSPIVEIDSDTEISCYFEDRNLNKKSIVLDLQDAEGISQLKEILASTDILLESFKPGTLKSLGIEMENFPHLITTSITPFGQTGPYSQYEATNETIFAMSGWLGLSGSADKPPITAPGYMAYDVAGIMGCFASLVALIKRKRTGTGQHIDVSALESLAQCCTWGVINSSAVLNADMPPARMRTGISPLYKLFPTKDGMVRLVILSKRQWQALWKWLGEPEEFSDPIWEQTIQRIMNADVLNPYFERLFAPMTMEACAEEAQKRGVVVTPLLKPNDILNNSHFISRKTFTDVEIAPNKKGQGKKGKIVNGWLEINSERIGSKSRAPSLGEHTTEILSQKNEPIQMEQNPDEEAGLKGLRVMDFGHGGVGVEGSKLLAEYGADVIKIESRTYLDFIRTVMGTEMSPSFASSNRSKRSLGVNAKNPKGNEVLCKLAEISDIVIENNSSDTMKGLGMEYEKLQKINPNITMSSSQMMGSHGTYRGWIGYGPTISTVGGIDWLWGYDDGDPPPGTQHIHPDHMAGRLCGIAGLLGVIAREKTGSGFHAEMAQVEKLIWTLGDVFLKESLEPGSVIPQGNNKGGAHSIKDASVWNIFKCLPESDDWENWCVICTRDEAEWNALVKLMGTPKWTQETALSIHEGRLQNQDIINQGITEWTKDFTSMEVMEKCQATKIPAGAMIFTDQIITNPHYVERGFAIKHAQQGLEGELYFEGAGFSASNLPPAYFSQAPTVGEHTREICKDLLNLKDEEIENLIESSALEVT